MEKGRFELPSRLLMRSFRVDALQVILNNFAVKTGSYSVPYQSNEADMMFWV